MENKSVHPALERERAQSTFDVRNLTYFLYGGKEETERREFIYSIVENDPEFRTG